MFKNISINLTGPICTCEELDLSWGIWRDKENLYGLLLECKNCHVELHIPRDKFLAHFKLDTPYPGGEKSSKPKLESIDGGKVLDLKPRDSE